MNKNYDETSQNKSKKAADLTAPVMRIMSEDEILDTLVDGYSTAEKSAILFKARCVCSFNMKFQDGRKEFFDFRRPA